MKDLLTFELSRDGMQIDIHGSKDGLTRLMSTIANVIERGTHEHLMTPAWAGDELSEDRQCEDSRIINKVTIHVWDD